MAHEGLHGNQRPEASNHHGATSPATVTNAPSPCESNNGGTWTASPVVPDASKVKETISSVHGEEHGSAASGSRIGAGLSKGKRSAADVVAADVTNEYISKGKGKDSSDDAMSGGDKAQPHVIKERERRKRIKYKFADLQALLPHVPEKADKATIVSAAINFIRVLEDTVATLENRKQELTLERQAVAAELRAASPSAASSDAAQVVAPSLVLPLPQGWGWLPKKKPQQHLAAAAAPPRIGLRTWTGANVMLNVSNSNDDAYFTVCAPRRPGVLPLVLSVLATHRIDVITAEVSSVDGARSIFNIHTRVNAEAIQQLGDEVPTWDDIYKLALSEIMVWLPS